MDTDEELSQEPWFEQERGRALGLACPRERCQELLCQRVRDVRFYSMELGEMRFERAAKRGRGVLLWRPTIPLPTPYVYAVLLRGGYEETSLPRPKAMSPTYCIFLDCAAVETALRGGEGSPARLLDWKTDVLRRNDKLGRRCWTCGFRCCASECNYKECALCGRRGHLRLACRNRTDRLGRLLPGMDRAVE